MDRRFDSLRWPDGPRCPDCGSGEVGGTPRGWRCKACRRSFRWSTRTALHSTKMSADAWMRAATLPRPDRDAVVAELGCSIPTARRVAAMLSSADAPAGSPPESKIRSLLAQGRRPPRRQQARLGNEAPPSTVEDAARSLTRCERAVVSALRRRVFGAPAPALAALSGVSAGHARRCLRGLERRGWAVCERRARPWGYKQMHLRLWRLTWSGECAEMLAHVHPERLNEPPRHDSDRVPPEFWLFNFWSGTPADKLTISANGLLIAEAMITGHDPAARQWALGELPRDVLEQCRQLRGCDSGPNAADIDAALAVRRD